MPSSVLAALVVIIVTLLLLGPTMVLAQTPKVPSFPQYAMKITAHINSLVPISNKTYTVEFDIAVDRVNKRLKILSALSENMSYYLFTYNAQWDNKTLFRVEPNTNGTQWRCRSSPADLRDFWENYDYLNTYAQNAQYTGKAITVNPKNTVVGANAFSNKKMMPSADIVAYYCMERGFPLIINIPDGHGTVVDTFKVTSFSDQVSDSDFSLYITEPSQCSSNIGYRDVSSNWSPLKVLFGRKK